MALYKEGLDFVHVVFLLLVIMLRHMHFLLFFHLTTCLDQRIYKRKTIRCTGFCTDGSFIGAYHPN